MAQHEFFHFFRLLNKSPCFWKWIQPIIRLLWFALADSIEIFIQSSIRAPFFVIMLHDLAKVIELTGPEKAEYTVCGNLIGHIALIDE